MHVPAAMAELLAATPNKAIARTKRFIVIPRWQSHPRDHRIILMRRSYGEWDHRGFPKGTSGYGKGPVPKIQNVMVRGANGAEKQLVLLYISGDTAYVCAPSHYPDAVENLDFVVGFPKRDVRLLETTAN